MAARSKRADEVSQSGPEEQEDVSEPLVWKVFTPAVVNPTNCQARTWAAGCGGQCSKKPSSENNLCESHEKQFGSSKGLAHGFVTGPIPKKKLEEFEIFALQSSKSREKTQKKEALAEEKSADCGEKSLTQKSVGSTPELKKRRLHGKSSKKRVPDNEPAAPSPKKLRRLKRKQPSRSTDEGGPPPGADPASPHAVARKGRRSVEGATGTHVSITGSESKKSMRKDEPSAGSAPSCNEDHSSASGSSMSSGSSSDSDSDDDPSSISATQAIVQEMLVLKNNEARMALLRVALREKRAVRLRAYVSAGVLQAVKLVLEDAIKDDKSADSMCEEVALTALKLLTCLPITTSHLKDAGLIPIIKSLRVKRSSTQGIIHQLVLQLRAVSGGTQAEVRSNVTDEKHGSTDVVDRSLCTDAVAAEPKITEADLAEVESATRAALAENTSSDLDATSRVTIEAGFAEVEITTRTAVDTSTSSALDSTSSASGVGGVQARDHVEGQECAIPGKCDQSSVKLHNPDQQSIITAVGGSAVDKAQRDGSALSVNSSQQEYGTWRRSTSRQTKKQEHGSYSAEATIQALLELEKVLKS